jgi:signal peptidase I
MPPQQIVQDPISIPDYQEPLPTKSGGSEAMRNFLSTVGVIVAAILFAMLLTGFVFQSYQVDGPSMETTLQDQDRLIIWKVPRTIARISGNNYIPNRGDVIVFVDRGFASPDGTTKQLIKRVIGLPGDRVVIDNGTLTVYSPDRPSGFNPDKTLPYGDNIDLSINPNDSADELIGPGQLYVLGDNRNNSLDSRAFGPVEAHNIVGKLVLRIFPLDNAKAF